MCLEATYKEQSRLSSMKVIITSVFICAVIAAKAITTFSGTIDIHKTNLTQLEVDYTFVLDKTDTVFSADSFSSTISCSGTSASIMLANLVEISRNKLFFGCAVTEYKWEVIYRTSIDLTDARFSTLVSCCNLQIDATCGKRSNTITSLTTSLSDFYIYTQFENCTTLVNRTPTSFGGNFSKNCLDQPFYINIGRLDTANFDSLSYTLVAPMSSTSSSLAFKSGYYPDQPLIPYYPSSTKYPYSESNATPPIGFYFDSLIGDCIYMPVNTGDAGPVTIETMEWRKDGNGKYQKISTSHTEYFIGTSQCPRNNPPNINGPYTYKVCEGETLCFNIETEDITFIPPPPAPIPSPDSVRVSWNGGIPQATFNIITPRVHNPVSRFCWTPEIGQASSLPYTFIVVARDNSCPLNAVTRRSFRITVNEKGKANTTYSKDTDSTISVSSTFISTRGTHSIKRTLMDIDKNPILDKSIARFASSSGYLSVTKDDHVI